MPEGQESRLRDRSVSGDFEVCPTLLPVVFILNPTVCKESDFDSHAGDANPPGKPGRKKNPKCALLAIINVSSEVIAYMLILVLKPLGATRIVLLNENFV